MDSASSCVFSAVCVQCLFDKLNDALQKREARIPSLELLLQLCTAQVMGGEGRGGVCGQAGARCVYVVTHKESGWDVGRAPAPSALVLKDMGTITLASVGEGYR